MSYYQQTPPDKDPQLWDLARRRASFKTHLAIYIIVNLFLWGVWYFTDGERRGLAPWPVWGTFGWGIGVAFHYIGAYVTPNSNSVDKEYEKLMREKSNTNQ